MDSLAKTIIGANQSTPDLWMHHMSQGEFETAWKYSDEVMKSRGGKPCWHLPRHFQHIWDGRPLEDKKVLIRCYHGLGDTIQFIRYAIILKAIANKVIVWAQPQLLQLLRTVKGIDQLVPLHDGAPEVDFEVDIEVMELPYIFRTVVALIPAEIPYFYVDPVKIRKNNGRLAIGLVWQAGDWDQTRSVPFPLLLPLQKISGVDFYILQFNAQSSGWHGEFGINPGNLPLDEYARFVRGLDLLISVDSMPVHLAGALGIPVWAMLKADADWRWMSEREDSPWYPTMRLFRQQHPGDWAPVISSIVNELTSLTRMHADR